MARIPGRRFFHGPLPVKRAARAVSSSGMGESWSATARTCSGSVGGKFDGIAARYGVAAFDVFEVAQDWAGWQAASLSAEVPLQVADPEEHFGDGGGARVDFEAEESVRVNGEAFDFEELLRVAKLGKGVEDFAFEPLHVFERDVEEVAGAAGMAPAGLEMVDLHDGEILTRLNIRR